MLLQTAIDTAARHQLATAPELSTGQGAAGGALIVGLLTLMFAIAKWKHWGKEAKTTFIIGCIAMIMIGTGGSGLLGQLTGSVHSTGDQFGTTLTSTVGR